MVCLRITEISLGLYIFAANLIVGLRFSVELG